MRWLSFVALVGCASQSPPPAAPLPPTAEPAGAQTVAPAMLEGRRVKGSILIPPDDVDKMKMVERGLTRVINATKLCIGVDGHVASAATLTSSGIPSYDEKIRRRTGEWVYTPYTINGKPAAVCTVVTVVYNQRVPERRR